MLALITQISNVIFWIMGYVFYNGFNILAFIGVFLLISFVLVLIPYILKKSVKVIGRRIHI